MLQHIGPLFANVAKAMVGIFIFLIALYYLFKDGHKLKTAVVALSPLQDIHDETIFDKLVLAINSVIKGSLAVAFIQGILTAVGLAIFGVPNAVLWSSVAAITALIPDWNSSGAPPGHSLPILQRTDAFRGRSSSLGDDGSGTC